jgi:hypothetical protein
MAEKCRKYDRNRDWCKAYRASGKHEKSHARRVLKHIIRSGMKDVSAIEYWHKLPALARRGLTDAALNPVQSSHKRIPPKYKGKAMNGKEINPNAA